jgi:hypothetical protein
MRQVRPSDVAGLNPATRWAKDVAGLNPATRWAKDVAGLAHLVGEMTTVPSPHCGNESTGQVSERQELVERPGTTLPEYGVWLIAAYVWVCVFGLVYSWSVQYTWFGEFLRTAGFDPAGIATVAAAIAARVASRNDE